MVEPTDQEPGANRLKAPRREHCVNSAPAKSPKGITFNDHCYRIQLPLAGTISNVIDLSAERERRRPRARLDIAAAFARIEALDEFVCSEVRAGMSEARGARHRQPESLDLSCISFEDCADALKALARVPFSDVDEALHYAMSALIEPLWTRLMDLDTKRGIRVIRSVEKPQRLAFRAAKSGDPETAA
jgi:hypothetical protein